MYYQVIACPTMLFSILLSDGRCYCKLYPTNHCTNINLISLSLSLSPWSLMIDHYISMVISETLILLMEEILHHLGCMKPCKLWLTTTNLNWWTPDFWTINSISIVHFTSRVFVTQPLAAKVLTEEVPTETLEVAFVETITEADTPPGGSWWKLVYMGSYQL